MTSRALAALPEHEGAARSLSGLRNVRNRQGDLEPVQGPPGADNIAFRQPASRDGRGLRGGLTRITEYSERTWEEYFAEAFSLYLTAPAELQRLRPSVYEYFFRSFPRGNP